MDHFYCLVRIILNKKIALYYINYNLCSDESLKYISYPICFTARSSNFLIKLLSLHNCHCLFSIRHALYIGQELHKAEVALVFNQSYVQE